MIIPLVLAVSAAPSGSPVQLPTAPSKAEDSDFAVRTHQAEQLVAANRPDEARALLEELEKHRPRDSQVQFLLGLLDRQDEDYESAARRFRRILVDDPKAVRVRLELALTFYEEGDFSGAERQFRFARAGQLPPGVSNNVDRYLGIIRQRKTFSYGFSLAVSPDSNLNAGPATDTVTLYGLPFELSAEARQRSGIGVIGDITAEWAPRVARNLKMRLGGQFHRAQYGASIFNDMTAAIYAGPRLNLKRWEFNLAGSAARRWYGNHPYTDMVAGSADATYYLTPRLSVGGALGLNHVDYARNVLQTGSGGTLAANLSYVPTPASFVRATIQAGRQDARAKAYASNTILIGAQYLRELKGGFTVGFAPSFTSINFDEPLAAFGATRRDRQYTIQTTVLNRRIDLYGLTPRVSYTFTRNNSTVALYRFSRSRFEVGITSAF